MRTLKHLFEKNSDWAHEMVAHQPDFFARLSRQQSPQYLWIGCSDSRVPANQIVGLAPGEMFVHRNVANVVVEDDPNCLAVIQFAVEVLKVGHIIVCGHYGCGGVPSGPRSPRPGAVGRWVGHVQDVQEKHRAQLDALPDEKRRHDRLCELNVIEQTVHVSRTSVVREAWARGQRVNLHGWIYGIEDGLLRDLGMCLSSETELRDCYEQAVAAPVRR